MKNIHYHLYDLSGPHIFYKPKANDKPEAHVISCNNSENCELFKKGQCVLRQTFGCACPYGRYQRISGPTRRAKGFYDWCRDMNNTYAGVGTLKSPPKKLAIVGDYIYVPYSHASMNENVPFLSKSGFLMGGSDFIKATDWNVDTAFAIINFTPRALFGGVITSYQEEQVPLFIRHLEEVMPNMYSQLLEKYPSLTKSYNLTKKDYIGRTAILKTINPCTFKTDGYKGDYVVTWVWDGTVATTNSEYAYATWGRLKDGTTQTTFTPSDKTTVTITDNSQVGPQTVFVD